MCVIKMYSVIKITLTSQQVSTLIWKLIVKCNFQVFCRFFSRDFVQFWTWTAATSATCSASAPSSTPRWRRRQSWPSLIAQSFMNWILNLTSIKRLTWLQREDFFVQINDIHCFLNEWKGDKTSPQKITKFHQFFRTGWRWSSTRQATSRAMSSAASLTSFSTNQRGEWKSTKNSSLFPFVRTILLTKTYVLLNLSITTTQGRHKVIVVHWLISLVNLRLRSFSK